VGRLFWIIWLAQCIHQGIYRRRTGRSAIRRKDVRIEAEPKERQDGMLLLLKIE
jgi:hypothetical protein